jgi:uncharacterized protein YidB (DUF937 family)
MDILLGSSSGPLGKLLSSKYAPLVLALLPVVLQLLSSQQSGKEKSGKSSKSSKSSKSGQSGLESILGSLTSNGLGDIVGSWIGGGPNKKITPTQVKKGLGPARVKEIADQAGLSVGDASKGLSVLLPVLVNELTPKAEVPQPSALDVALQGLSGLLPKS